MDRLIIRVIGIPGPQGSKSPKGRDRNGRTILVESSAKVKPWREAVVWAAREAMGLRERFTGPVEVGFEFLLPKPKSVRRRLPDRKPDLSKLVRSTEDALTDAGVWEDDARVVDLRATKRYPEGREVPGAVISIREG